ncbi:MAG: VOC family protein [Vicinamibacterales bacterium]
MLPCSRFRVRVRCSRLRSCGVPVPVAGEPDAPCPTPTAPRIPAQARGRIGSVGPSALDDLNGGVKRALTRPPHLARTALFRVRRRHPGVLRPARRWRRPEDLPNPDHLYFAVNGLDACLERVQATPEGFIDRPIATQPWGERTFYCRDPFGNRLCFVEEGTLFTAGLL